MDEVIVSVEISETKVYLTKAKMTQREYAEWVRRIRDTPRLSANYMMHNFVDPGTDTQSVSDCQVKKFNLVEGAKVSWNP